MTVASTDGGASVDTNKFGQASFEVVCRARIEPSIRATSKHVGTPVVRHPLSYLVEPGGLEPPTPSLKGGCSPSGPTPPLSSCRFVGGRLVADVGLEPPTSVL